MVDFYAHPCLMPKTMKMIRTGIAKQIRRIFDENQNEHYMFREKRPTLVLQNHSDVIFDETVRYYSELWCKWLLSCCEDVCITICFYLQTFVSSSKYKIIDKTKFSPIFCLINNGLRSLFTHIVTIMYQLYQSVNSHLRQISNYGNSTIRFYPF